MIIVQINAFCGTGSTGKICVGISRCLTESHIDNRILYYFGLDYTLGVQYTNSKYIHLQALKSHLLGNYGFQAQSATKRLIRELEALNPDIVHLHNIHSHNCNLAELFSYFKEKKTKLVWTFHDCWAFTAYCPYFDLAKCDRWKTGCHNCPQRKKFSWLFDQSRWLYRKKKELFSGLDLTIITPSEWLAGLVRKSFLKDYPVQVIHNGIDLSVFHPTKSSFRTEYNIPSEKKILLGVAYDWSPRKGLDVFISLVEKLPFDKYQIVLVGTNKKIDRQLPPGVISIHHTKNQQELAEIYTVADVFINPTREEVLGLVNVEALACGTPGVTFNSGGSPECYDETCGSIVPCDNIDALEKEIIRICETKPFTQEACLQRAKEFDMNERFQEYVNLYNEIITQ